MDTRIYNIDSELRNITAFPNASDFVYNRMEQSEGQIEPFNEKNVIEMKILSIELPDLTNLPSFNDQYLFLRINDFGNIINKNYNYVAKVLSTTFNQQSCLITNTIKFNQPIDITQLKIRLEDKNGDIINLGDDINFSFTLEIVVVTNTILKNYDQVRFYSDIVMDRILKAKMLAFYEKQADTNVNNTITSTYNSNLVNLNSMQEYTALGNTNNYAPSFSYFTDMNRKK